MAVRELGNMTWEDVRDLDGSRTVALLPVGAVEAHGPHLPLATDVVIAEAMAREGARRLADEGLEPLLLPTLTYTAAGFAAAFPGTVSVAPEAVEEAVLGVAGSLARHGIRTLALANAHLDPDHLAALSRAADRAARTGIRMVFPDITRKPWAPRLGEEFRSGACHAGRFEGSVVLAAAPELVREEVRAALPPNPASLSQAIREGKSDFLQAGGPRAYFGWPAEATAREGRETIATLGEILREAVTEALSADGQRPPAADRHPSPADRHPSPADGHAPPADGHPPDGREPPAGMKGKEASE